MVVLLIWRYEALGNMGLSKGNVLEPSCGVGNFMGLVPDNMEKIRMYGVELDSISGRIAQQLYQKNKIAVQGFETMQFPDSFFDCVVGNVPFGNYKVPDKRYDRHNFLIHDYFIAKSLDLVRPGGVVAVVTSSGTMDKKDSSVREYLANRADLVGAIRLPNNAFQRNANTSVVADILFLQKRDRAAVERADWVDLGETPDGYSINQYFAQHPEMVLGEITTESTQYGKQETTVKPIEGADLAKQLKEAVGNIHATITEPEISDDELDVQEEPIPADPSVKNFSFTNVDRVFQIKEVHHQHWAKSYAQQVEDGFLIHHQNYQSAYKGKPAPSDTPMTARKRLEEKRPNTFIGRSFGVGDVIVWDEEKGRKFFYVDKEELVEFGGFMDADAAGNTVVYMVPNYQIDGKTGTWLPYDSEVVEGVCFFMMRNEQRKDAVSPIVVDSKGVFVTDAPNGFENIRAVLTEYVRRAEKKQQDMTEHEKCLTNGTYERARESGTEQNYDMIDGCVNNVPKKPRRIGGRWSVLDRLHIKQAERKQKDQTQQQHQERSRKN